MSGGRSSSSNATSSTSNTIDAKQTADGEAIVARAEGGDVIINKTLGDALPIAERAFDTADFALAAQGTAFEEAINFASSIVRGSEDLSRDSIAYVSDANEQALGVVSSGFEKALQASEEDTTKLLSQAITYGVPALIVYLIWSRTT